MTNQAGLEADVQVDGLSVRLSVGAGCLHVAGEFSGNIDLTVRSQPTLPPKLVLESLAIRTHAGEEPVTALAYESFPDGRLEITFHSPSILGLVPRPQDVELQWCAGKGRSLGVLALTAVRD